MKKILNIMFIILKYILLLGAFAITLFIIVRMNARLSKSFSTVIPEFIPFLLIFLLFVINLLFKQKGVNNNIFYNLTSCIVFATIILVGYRAFADKNMVLNEKYGYGVDFNYFYSLYENYVVWINCFQYIIYGSTKGKSKIINFFLFLCYHIRE